MMSGSGAGGGGGPSIAVADDHRNPRGLNQSLPSDISHVGNQDSSKQPGALKKKPSRRRTGASSPKRRCISTACIACRKRKSKCDGAVPSCAACSSVYGTECIYDPNSDHRRKGVYKDKVDSMKARNSTLQILIEAILNATEEESFDIVRRIRTCDSLDSVAEQLLKQEAVKEKEEEEANRSDQSNDEYSIGMAVEGERDLARKMGELRLENGSVRFIGGTSHLIYAGDPSGNMNEEPFSEQYPPETDPITTWTSVTSDPQLIKHLIDKYFSYHYAYFTTLSRKMFEQDFLKGRAGLSHKGTVYCSSLLVNAMLALGCHFTDIPEAYGIQGDNRTKGDHFFAEAKRIITENSEYEKPRLVTVQALALMSVREAGCAREAKGWVYSGMSFRMAQDIGLNLEIGALEKEKLTEHEIDARRMTFWGCFLFDKAWSNYLGRLPLIPQSSFNVSKFDVFPEEDGSMWVPFPDSGMDASLAQPSRTRAAALQLSRLCEISSDLLIFFYHPSHIGRSSGKAAELKKVSELHRRLEDWRKELPSEFEPKEGQLPNVILMHMFFHLQYIHLFRPFLKYAPNTSPLPNHVSPRRICTANAGAISKLMRLYKKSWNLRQICNIAVYMIHSACTIHLLNLPEKTARRDVIHGVRHLEEMAEDWLCARRTLSILSVLARKWKCEVPEDAAFVLQRADEKYGSYSMSDVPSPRSQITNSPSFFSDKAAVTAPANPDLSPLSRMAQVQMSQASPHGIQVSIENQMGMQPSLHNFTPGGTSSAQNQQQMPIGTPGMDFSSPEALGPWNTPSPQGPPNISGVSAYSAPFMQMGRTSMSPDSAIAAAAAATAQSGGRQMAPGGVALGTQDWFLTDSARWAHNFDGWDTGSSGGVHNQSGNANGLNEGSPVFDLNDAAIDGGNGGGRIPDTNDQGAGVENLGTLLNGGSWVRTLD